MQPRLMASPDHQPDGLSDIENRSLSIRTSSAVEGCGVVSRRLMTWKPLRH
jgi:hypothetical protein